MGQETIPHRSRMDAARKLVNWQKRAMPLWQQPEVQKVLRKELSLQYPFQMRLLSAGSRIRPDHCRLLE